MVYLYGNARREAHGSMTTGNDLGTSREVLQLMRMIYKGNTQRPHGVEVEMSCMLKQSARSVRVRYSSQLESFDDQGSSIYRTCSSLECFPSFLNIKGCEAARNRECQGSLAYLVKAAPNHAHTIYTGRPFRASKAHDVRDNATEPSRTVICD